MGTEALFVKLDPDCRSESSGCQSPQSPPGSVERDVQKYFDENVEYWDEIYAGEKFINSHLAHRSRLVIDAVRRLSNGRSLRILDLGSGTGFLTREIARHGHHVVALDCSECMIRTLMSRVRDDSASHFLGAAVGSAAQVCLKSGIFDIILCIGVIQYQRNPDRIFREFCRLLKPGGLCIFTIPNQLSLHHLIDPWCGIRYIRRLVLAFCLTGGSSLRSWRVPLDNSAFTHELYEKRYFQSEILALIKRQPFKLREMIAFGYGPLTILNKPVLPERASIELSAALTRLAHFHSLSWLPTFANRWVVVLERES